MATTTSPTVGRVLYAAEQGGVDFVRRWLEGGGDPNISPRGTVHISEPEETDYYEGETPLMVAAMTGSVEVIRILVQAGADVNITRPAVPDEFIEEAGNAESALTLALAHERSLAAQILLDHGADKTTFQWLSPFQTHRCLGDHRILRMFFVAGVDPLERELDGQTFEVAARARLVRYRDLQYARLANKYGKVVELIDGVRAAGSYREFILRDYKQLLRIRSLLARSRATMALETPEVIRRLFGGTTAVPTRRSRSPPERFAGVPDPIFWKVLEFWRLGDWRRPGKLPPC